MACREEKSGWTARSKARREPLGETHKPQPRKLTWLIRGLIAALALYNAIFVQKMSPPHVSEAFFFDFSNFYAGARALLRDNDPYVLHQVFAAWHRSDPGAHLGVAGLEQRHLWAAIYPPSSLVMLSPLVTMPAVWAHLSWFLISLALFGGTCKAVWSMAKVRGWEARLLIALLLFTWGPGASALDAGQLSLPACAAVIFAVWAMRKRRLTLAGLLLGYAAALKIQVGAPFILYYVLLRHWRVAGIAAAILLVTSVIGIIPLQMRDVPWQQQWLHNCETTLAPGEVNDPRPQGPFRNDMINLQTLLYCVTGNDHEVQALTAAIVLSAIAIFLILLHYTPRPATDLLMLSLVALLSFLPVYRRLYDAGTLALLVVWALTNLRTPLRRYALITLALMAELVIPIDLVPAVARRIDLSSNITESRWWQGVVVPHHAWGILLLTAWMLFMLCAIRLRVPGRRIRKRLEYHRGPVPT